jgi:hypothetical protein
MILTDFNLVGVDSGKVYFPRDVLFLTRGELMFTQRYIAVEMVEMSSFRKEVWQKIREAHVAVYFDDNKDYHIFKNILPEKVTIEWRGQIRLPSESLVR